MTPRIPARLVCALALGWTLSGCGGGEKPSNGERGAEPPPMPQPVRALRLGVETQMIALLRSIADAQERAHVDRGRYLEWSELRRDYYPDPLPPNLQVRLVVLGDQAYEVEVTHAPSGIRCGLAKGTTGGIYGAPRCR
jgi:hypothetical protein